jgi:hypothetical protein
VAAGALILALGVAGGAAGMGIFYADARALFAHPNLFGNLESLVTAVGLTLAGWWTYSKFVRTRETAPRVHITQRVQHVPLDKSRVLVHVDVNVRNRGNGLLVLDSIETTIQHVHPLRRKTLDELITDSNKSGRPMIEWRTLARRVHRPDASVQLEPNETEHGAFDFVVDGRVRVVSVYTFAPSADQRGAPAGAGLRIGWSCRSMHRLDMEPEVQVDPRRRRIDNGRANAKPRGFTARV